MFQVSLPLATDYRLIRQVIEFITVQSLDYWHFYSSRMCVWFNQASNFIILLWSEFYVVAGRFFMNVTVQFL